MIRPMPRNRGVGCRSTRCLTLLGHHSGEGFQSDGPTVLEPAPARAVGVKPDYGQGEYPEVARGRLTGIAMVAVVSIPPLLGRFRGRAATSRRDAGEPALMPESPQRRWSLRSTDWRSIPGGSGHECLADGDPRCSQKNNTSGCPAGSF